MLFLALFGHQSANVHDAKERVQEFSGKLETVRSIQTGSFDSHEVSASSSFLRFILSFRPSASRRAAAIWACICSPVISDIVESDYPGEGEGICDVETMTGIGGTGVEGTVGGLERPPPDSRPQRMNATHNSTKKFENGRAFFGLWVCVKVQARWDDVFAVADCLVAWSGKLG